MKKILFLLSGLALSFSLASCQMDNSSTSSTATTNPTTTDNVSQIEYSVEIVDFDGTILGSKEITTTNNKSLFDDLKTNFNVKYSESQYGPFISEINSSLVDPNYSLMLYQNGTMASTGVDGIILNDNDEIKFVNECWNTELDEVDKMVDKVIYSFMKDADDFLSAEYSDFYLLGAINKMMELGYSSMNLDFLSDTYLETIKNKDLNTVNSSNLLGHAILLKSSNTPLDTLKAHIESTKVDVVGGPYGIYSNIPYYLGAKMAGATIINESEYKESFKASLETEIGDSGAFLMHVLPTLDGVSSDLKDKFIANQVKTFTEDGVKFDEWSSMGVSAGCQIRGFAAIGENIRDEKYQVNGVDMVEAVLKYLVNDYEFKVNLTDTEANNSFATPQILAGLMAYKMSRDLKNTDGSFKAVDIFA